MNGLGTIGGFKLQIEDRGGRGDQALDAAMKAFLAKAYQTPELAGVFSSFQINVPQLFADVDRTKAKRLGVALTDVFDTMQINLGVCTSTTSTASAAPTRCACRPMRPYRSRAEDIALLKTRSNAGEMVPLRR